MTLLLFSVCLLAGCNTAQQEASTTTSTTTTSTTSTTLFSGGREYFPNTNGYAWHYQVYSYFSPESYPIAMIFDGTTTVGSLTVQIQREEYYPPATYLTIEALVMVDDNTVSTYGTISFPTTEAFVLLNFPLTIGKTWLFTGTHEATVMTRESVTVPAGTFSDCLKVRYIPSNRQTTDYWYARDVGLIKGLTVHVDGTTTIELTSKNF